MKIYSASNPTEAHIVCGLLHAQEIRAEVRGEGIFGLKGEIPMTEDTDPYVWLLDKKKLRQAEALVSEYRHQQQTDSPWLCEKCGEENEGQFGACWNCSADEEDS